MSVVTSKPDEGLMYYEPPAGLFRYKAQSAVQRVLREKQVIRLFAGVSYPKSGGIFTHYAEGLYPEKGLKIPEAGMANDIVKKNVLGLLTFLTGSKWIVLPALGFLFVPWKGKIAILDPFLLRQAESADNAMVGIYMHKRFQSAPVRALRQLIYLFLKFLGFSKWVCSRWSEILTTFVQWDDQHRYMLQDVISMADKQRLMDNPRKEIFNLFKVYFKRAPGAAKLGPIGEILSYALYHPKVKRAFVEAVRLTDIDKIKLDEADMYNALCMGPYKFMGVPLETRQQTYLTMHKGKLPPWIEITSG